MELSDVNVFYLSEIILKERGRKKDEILNWSLLTANCSPFTVN